MSFTQTHRPAPKSAVVLISLLTSLAAGGVATAQTVAAVEAVPKLPAAGTMVPAGTHVRFHLDTELSSDKSKTGQHFTFTMLDPIVVDDVTVVNAGAHGDGTVILAGRSGMHGHEGDLTLRIDTIDTPNGNRLTYANTRVEINGTNRKVASAVLGFVPYVGIAARFIHGAESRVGTDVPVLIVTKQQASVLEPPAVEAAAPPNVPPAPDTSTSNAPAPAALPSAPAEPPSSSSQPGQR